MGARRVLGGGPFFVERDSGVPNLSGFLGNDKLIHGALYTVMGAFLAWGALTSRARLVWPALLPGYLYGAVDEWHQMYVPRRVPSVLDYAADVVGVTLGFVLVLLVLGGRMRSKRTVGEESA